MRREVVSSVRSGEWEDYSQRDSSTVHLCAKIRNGLCSLPEAVVKEKAVVKDLFEAYTSN